MFGEWYTLSDGGDGGGDGGDGGGRIFRRRQPPPHHAQGFHIPFGSPLTPINNQTNTAHFFLEIEMGASGWLRSIRLVVALL